MTIADDRDIVIRRTAPNDTGAPQGLYVHFPFCLSICPYCDFVVYAGSAARGPSNQLAAFVDALLVEIGLRARPGARLASVYLGGGTPSLLSAAAGRADPVCG